MNSLSTLSLPPQISGVASGSPNFSCYPCHPKLQLLPLAPQTSALTSGTPNFRCYFWHPKLQLLPLAPQTSAVTSGNPNFSCYLWHPKLQLLPLTTQTSAALASRVLHLLAVPDSNLKWELSARVCGLTNLIWQSLSSYIALLYQIRLPKLWSLLR